MNDQSDDTTKTLTITPAGEISLDLKQIRNIGVENIVDLDDHRIARDATGTTHEIDIVGGGQVRLSYSADGTIRHFTVQNAAVSATEENDIVIRRKPSGPRNA